MHLQKKLKLHDYETVHGTWFCTRAFFIDYKLRKNICIKKKLNF